MRLLDILRPRSVRLVWQRLGGAVEPGLASLQVRAPGERESFAELRGDRLTVRGFGYRLALSPEPADQRSVAG
jgi:hypothetical protein